VIERFKQWLLLRGQVRAVSRAAAQVQKRAPAAAPAASADAAPLRVLMVCMGNVCRSPIAEGVLRAKLQQAGLLGRVQVDSAGTHGYHTNEPPDPRSIKYAAQRGYNIAGQQARPVVAEDFLRFHWIMAMDSDNLAWLQKKSPAQGQGGPTSPTAPVGPNRIELLLSHAKRHPDVTSVPDPYYGPDAGFERVLDLVEDACDGLLMQLNAELAKPLRPPSALPKA
jgi:protein-tyrosine phosphatase